jgi:hypothetical protein
MNKKPKRGGTRAGAGRTAQDGAQSPTPRTVMLDSQTVEKARIIGSGNLSEGIRRAVSTVDFSRLLVIAENSIKKPS